MRIGFICNEYPPGSHGGIGTFVQTAARALAGAGHAVRVVGMYSANFPAEDYEEDHGVRVWRLRASLGRSGWLRTRYRLFRTVARWSRQREVDLIEVPDWEGWASGWRRLPVPVVVRLHGSSSYFAAEMGDSPRRIVALLEKAGLRRADDWCSVSRYTAEKTRRLFGLPTEPRAILYNPVEVPQVAAQSSRTRDEVLFAGTLVAKKGIVALAQAWPLVLQACPEARLNVFGKDGQTPGGESMTAFLRSQLGESIATVSFHGHVSRERLFDELRTARLAVFPSFAEAFALAPLEAMARGCPTIYSQRGSGPELIEHGRDGLLVEPDEPRDIAAAIIRLLQDDDLARRLGQAGRVRVQSHFSLDQFLPQNEAFYRDCLNHFHRRAMSEQPSRAPRAEHLTETLG